MKRLHLFPTILLFALVATFGCRAPECEQMLQCCEAVADMEGMGTACLALGEETRDPTTCRDVVRTIGYMLDDRDQTKPDACLQ